MENKKLKFHHVAVLMGGLSREREISLKTGRAISEALKRLGCQVSDIDAGRDVDQQLRKIRPEVAFIALHGRYGEDGSIQGLLEWMGIPYTGSGPMASSLAMHKVLTKKIVQAFGVTVPKEQVLHKGMPIPLSLSLPVIVKPNQEGSTIGMTIVRAREQFEPAVKKAFEFDQTILVEEYIQGKEITVGVLNGQVLPPLEIVPKSGFYDFESKYTKGKTEYIVPARISTTMTDRIKKEAGLIFEKVDFSGAIRLDYILAMNGQQEGLPYFLEVNTIPGMTELSLVPMMARSIGMSFDQVVEAMLNAASLKVRAL
ncbi:MAG: D-alanine--D-alanine ligase [bacterium]|nr:D-alanine--D-alanine ligase [bacterium]